MWQQILSFLASVINIGNLLVENQQTLKELQKQVNTLEASLTIATERLEHFTEMERANQKHFTDMERARIIAIICSNWKTESCKWSGVCRQQTQKSALNFGVQRAFC